MTTRIELICGCMFGGKTTELIRRVRECRSAHAEEPELLHSVALKPAIDDRYSPTDIVSHNGERLAAQAVRTAADVLEQGRGAELVVIDEIHFFEDDIVDVCRKLSERGVRVICCGLDRDMWGVEFAHVRRLKEYAETTVMLGVCRQCGRPADRTQRIAPLVDDHLVGGAEAFEPRCAACFHPPATPRPAGSVRGLAHE